MMVYLTYFWILDFQVPMTRHATGALFSSPEQNNLISVIAQIHLD
jgi:hypothetical protein